MSAVELSVALKRLADKAIARAMVGIATDLDPDDVRLLQAAARALAVPK